MEFIGPCTPIKEIYLKTSLAPHCAYRRMELGEHFSRAYLVDQHDVIRVEIDKPKKVVVLVPLHKVEHILLESESEPLNAPAEESSKQPSKPVRRSRKAKRDTTKS